MLFGCVRVPVTVNTVILVAIAKPLYSIHFKSDFFLVCRLHSIL